MKIGKNLHIILRNKKVYLLFRDKAVNLIFMDDAPLDIKILVALWLIFMLVWSIFGLETSFWLKILLKLR